MTGNDGNGLIITCLKLKYTTAVNNIKEKISKNHHLLHEKVFVLLLKNIYMLCIVWVQNTIMIHLMK